jgi:hypothetical protein
MRPRSAALALAVALAAGCAEEEPAATQAPAPARPAEEYLGVETRLLDPELVNLRVTLAGDATAEELRAYADCAAAQYALIRGYGFARHVRTNLGEEGGNSTADAVYTISPSLPPGFATLDAEAVVEDCAARGIPTV